MKFGEKLKNRAHQVDSWVCLGLDPVLEKIPSALKSEPRAIAKFSKEIIRATKDVVCSYKLNLAFFESAGLEGWKALRDVLEEIPDDVITIADGKRGDIGNTSRQYAAALFTEWGFDAQTVNPYLGMDALEPFFDYPEKGIFVLCLTSNPGANDIQRKISDGEPIFCHVARMVGEANHHENCGLVIGATQAEDLPGLRRLAPSLPFLIPGIGAQGGDLASSILEGTDSSGDFALINSSRGILYASSGDDFAEAARDAAIVLRDQINQYRNQKRGRING